MKRIIACFIPLLLLIGIFSAAPAGAQLLDWSNAWVEGPGNNVIIRDVRFLSDPYSICWEWDSSANLLFRNAIAGTVGDVCGGGPGPCSSTVSVYVSISTLFGNPPIPGANVILSNTMDYPGTTDPSGIATIPGVPCGSYELIVSAAGYITSTTGVVVDDPTETFLVALSAGLAEGQYRIVLTWGGVPIDLDSHLLIPDGYHLFFPDSPTWGPGLDPTVYPYATLDVDAYLYGYGPETVTIHQNLVGIYRYFVHNYAQEFYSDQPLTVSEATVTLYRGATQLQSWSVPTSGAGLWWHVFDLDAVNQIVTPFDVIVGSEPAFP